MKVFVSNEFKILADRLREELFSQARHPLESRYVVVPSDAMKQELFLRWGRELGIAAGFKMMTWKETLGHLFPQIPSKLELALKIEQVIEELETVSKYLDGGGEKRKLSLCDRLATLFMDYLLQPEEKLLQWLAREGWQQILWKRVFETEIPWNNHHLLEETIYFFNPLPNTHIFNVLKKMDTTCFLFSPCREYWGDFRTVREQRFFKTSLLQEYFEKDHPLLANWGKKGRELLELFENEEWIDEYREKENVSLLKNLQNEMLTLTTLEKNVDDSIQIHSAPSKTREIEIVWEIIQDLPYEPSEILVLVSNMESYAAPLEFIFRLKGGVYDFSIFGLKAYTKSLLMQGVQDLLNLLNFNFSKEALIKLLYSPLFLKKFNLSLMDVQQLLEWIHVSRGRYDLKESHPWSWEKSLKRLVEGLVRSKEVVLAIDFSDADLLSRFISIFQLLESDLSSLNQTKLSLKQWSHRLISLIENFFFFEKDDSFFRAVEGFKNSTVEGVFSWPSMQHALQSIFENSSESFQSSHLQAVRFCPLENEYLTPAKAIILMGLEEGNFPKQNMPCSLQELPPQNHNEKDRYLFLEAICSAHEKFIITYTRLNEEDGKSQKSSCLVEELEKYCKIIPIHHPPQNKIKKIIQEKKVLSLSPIHPTVWQTWMLRKLARHPLHFFFEERLGIDFEWEENGTEFGISALELSQIRKESLKKPFDEILKKLETDGRLPVGSFARVAVKKIQEDIESYHAILGEFQISQIYSVELKPSVPDPIQKNEEEWIYPALTLQNVLIHGKIDGLSSQGFLYHGDGSFSDLLKVWPLYLILLNLGKEIPIVFTKKGKKLSPHIPDPKAALERYLQYADRALTTPSPLLPKWGNSFFKEGEIPSSEEEDSVVAWARNRNLLPESSPWVEQWMSFLNEVFHEIL